MTTDRKFTYIKQIYPENVIFLNEKPIKNTDNFRYLGSQIVHDKNTTGNWEVKCGIESAKNNFAFMKILLLNHGI